MPSSRPRPARRRRSASWIAFAAVYTPIVFVLAVLLALAAPQFMGWGWQQAAYQALALLVIACPARWSSPRR